MISDLLEAIRNEDLSALERCLAEAPELANSTQHSLSTPLGVAAARGSVEAIRILLRADADINGKGDLFAFTALHSAALAGQAQAAECLLENGADPSARDAVGHTPLHVAAIMGFADVCRLLLSAGADANARDDEALAPLHRAAARGCKQVTEVLVAAKANPNAQDGDGNTPLHASVLAELQFRDYGETESQIGRARKAVERTFRRFVQTMRAGETDHTLGSLPSLDWEPDRAGVAELLISAGADVDARNHQGLTPLPLAVACGNYEMFEPNLSETPGEGEEGQVGPQFLGHPQVVKVLLAAGADINARSKDGVSSLHRAVGTCNEEMVEILLSGAPDISARTDDGVTPLHVAVENGNERIVGMLLAGAADVGARENCQDWQSALQGGIDPETVLARGRTPLHVAVENRMVGIVQTLLDHGADPNVGDWVGFTPLHRAACFGDLDIGKMLIAHRAKVDARDWIAGTPLHAAALEGHREFCTFLLHQGAHVNAQDVNGLAPLHLALSKGHEHTARILRKRGASADIGGSVPLPAVGACIVCEKQSQPGRFFSARELESLSPKPRDEEAERALSLLPALMAAARAADPDVAYLVNWWICDECASKHFGESASPDVILQKHLSRVREPGDERRPGRS